MPTYVYQADAHEKHPHRVNEGSNLADAKAELAYRFNLICKWFSAQGFQVDYAMSAVNEVGSSFIEWVEIRVIDNTDTERWYGIGISEKVI